MQADNGQGSFYKPQQNGFVGDPQQQPDDDLTGQSVEWQASEYVHHSKGAGWLIILVVVTLIILSLAIWAGQWTFAVLIVIMGVAFGVYGFRQPREMHYHLSDDGLQINDKTYTLDLFRAFRVTPDGAFSSAQLIPVKRFMPAITVYFSQPDGEQIVDILGAHMPLEQVDGDLIEILMQKLRF